jgi:hypothetical protein
MKKIILLILLFIKVTGILMAQNDSVPILNSDRPLQGETPYLMHPRFFQIETGVRYVDRKDSEKQLQRLRVGTTLLRYGVFSNFEVRFSDGYEWVHVHENEKTSDSTESGIGPLTAGFKVLVAHEKGFRPEMSILGSITFRQIGDKAFRPFNSYPLGLLLCSHTITKKLKLGYNLGFSYTGESADGFFIYSIYSDYYFTKKIWAFVEAYGNFDHGDDPNNIDYSTNNLGDAGISYRIKRNLQVDISGGMAFDPHVSRYFASAGISWRIPR